MTNWHSSPFLNTDIDELLNKTRYDCAVRMCPPWQTLYARADANNNVGTFCCGHLLLPTLEFEQMFQNYHIGMLVNVWNNAPVKFICTASLHREQPRMFASVIQLEVAENVSHIC
jgi:hypothetical protein